MKSNHELAERYNKKCELLGLRSIKYKLLKDDRVELVSVDNRMDRLDIPSFITDIKAGVFKGKNYRYIKISGKIKDMSKMFMGIKSEELSVELVHPECVENANEMISQCKMLRSLMLINFNLINNITSIGMFRGDTVLVRLDISELKLPRCEVIDKLFELCTKLEEIDISGIGLRDIKRMVNIFYRCHRLRTVKLSGLDLRNVEVIDGIFNNCWSLEDIDIKGVKLNNVRSALDAFGHCQSLEYIDISDLCLNSIEDMSRLFNGCKKLRWVKLGILGGTLIKTNGMVNGCNNLEYIDGLDLIDIVG